MCLDALPLNCNIIKGLEIATIPTYDFLSLQMMRLCFQWPTFKPDKILRPERFWGEAQQHDFQQASHAHANSASWPSQNSCRSTCPWTYFLSESCEKWKLPKWPQTECKKVGLAPKVWQTESDHQHQWIKIWVVLILEAPKLTAAASAWRA